jgi:hypothetical protein
VSGTQQSEEVQSALAAGGAEPGEPLACKHFADPSAWQAHLERLGFTALTVTPDPTQIATEGALWGSIPSLLILIALSDSNPVNDAADEAMVGRKSSTLIRAASSPVHRAACRRHAVSAADTLS